MLDGKRTSRERSSQEKESEERETRGKDKGHRASTKRGESGKLKR